ncbi:MAG: hypothetical protein ACAI35_21055 [Candidatus Methylacidiphilales bacterium]|nr:hypothetical protein [Candidatus Methylacidiphilales bacterium]
MIHILNQFIWPDAAPTGVLAEQLGDDLLGAGHEVVLVGCRGSYRPDSRTGPACRVVKLEGYNGRRGSFASTLAGYWSAARAFRAYIARHVGQGDTVIVTSAPPSTTGLHGLIHSRKARSIYWLQDYYPELLRAVWDYPGPIRSMVRRYFDSRLRKWDVVVKVATNLAYSGENATLIRNWPTVREFDDVAAEPKTAVYFGNLGYAHDVSLFVARCEELRAQGYKIAVQGDGPGMKMLPEWIERRAPVPGARLRELYPRAEVHMVAAHPGITGALFPSKLWNSRAVGRRIVSSGFAGVMAEELELALHSDLQEPRRQWRELAGKPQKA